MSPWAVQEPFAQLAANPFYGSDGGNPHCCIWTVGIESGPPIPNQPPHEIPELYYFKNIPCWNEHFRHDYPEYQTWPFMRIVSRLIHGVFDHGWASNYEHLLTQDGHGFHLNLYPLGAQTLDDWSPAHAAFSGFPDKSLYRAWCMAHRFPGLRQLAQKHSPKVIMCSAGSFRDRFLTAFGDPNDLAHGTTHQIGIHNVYECSVNQGRTKLLISPFFGRGGLMENQHVDALAGLARGFITQ